MITIEFREEEKQALALDGDKIIGECTYSEAEGRWVVDHTGVRPEYGGQGIARQLVDEILSQARARDKKIEAQCSYAHKVLTAEAPEILTGEGGVACRLVQRL